MKNPLYKIVIKKKVELFYIRTKIFFSFIPTGRHMPWVEKNDCKCKPLSWKHWCIEQTIKEKKLWQLCKVCWGIISLPLREIPGDICRSVRSKKCAYRYTYLLVTSMFIPLLQRKRGKLFYPVCLSVCMSASQFVCMSIVKHFLSKISQQL